MARIVWDKPGTHIYETGIRNCVLFVQNADGQYQEGIAWNGIVSVTETSEGGDAVDFYADDIKYLTLYPPVDIGANIEAYTYPDEFLPCDGIITPIEGVTIGQQPRRPFAICYKTTIGNDILADDYGYKLHIVYGCTVSPSEKAYQATSDSPEPILFSWEASTMPVPVPGYRPTAFIVIDSTKVNPKDLGIIEEILYGNETENSHIMLPSEISEIFTNGLLMDESNNYLTIGGDRIRV